VLADLVADVEPEHPVRVPVGEGDIDRLPELRGGERRDDLARSFSEPEWVMLAR
jgi:hypothetical protein